MIRLALALCLVSSVALADAKKLSRETALEYENLDLRADALQRQYTELLRRKAELDKEHGVKRNDKGQMTNVAADGTIMVAEAPKPETKKVAKK